MIGRNDDIIIQSLKFIIKNPQINALSLNPSWDFVLKDDDFLVFKNDQNYFVKIAQTSDAIKSEFIFLGIANSLENLEKNIPNQKTVFSIPEFVISSEDSSKIFNQMNLAQKNSQNVKICLFSLALENFFYEYPLISSISLSYTSEYDDSGGYYDSFSGDVKVDPEYIHYLEKLINNDQEIANEIKLNYENDPTQYIDDLQNQAYDKLDDLISFYDPEILRTISDIGNINNGTFLEILNTLKGPEFIAKIQKHILDNELHFNLKKSKRASKL